MALSFSGTTDAFDTGVSTAANFSTGDFTLAAWVTSSSAGTVVAIGKNSGTGDSYWFGLAGGKLSCSVNATVTEVGNTVNDGNWHSIVATRISGTLTIYSDGTARNGGTASGSASPGNNLYIAKFGSGAAFNWPGNMAEVAVWSAGLDAAEVASLGKGVCPALIRPASLVEYWPLIGRYTVDNGLKGAGSGSYAGSPARVDHPRVMWRRRRNTSAQAATAAGGSTIPVLYRQRQMQGMAA